MRLPLALAVLFSAVLTIACGKEGSAGPAGPAGAGGPAGPAGTPYDRATSYCSSSSVVNAASNWSVSVTCANVRDIPIEGSCYAPDQPGNAFLAWSKPVDWSDTTKLAGWTCSWGWQPGTEPPTPDYWFSGTAEICCATPK